MKDIGPAKLFSLCLVAGFTDKFMKLFIGDGIAIDSKFLTETRRIGPSPSLRNPSLYLFPLRILHQAAQSGSPDVFLSLSVAVTAPFAGSVRFVHG